MATKVCTKCGEQKLLADFPPDKSRPMGRRAACRVCHRARLSLWRKAIASPEQREKRRKHSSAWREKHRELNLALQAEYRRKNADGYRAWARASYRKDVPAARVRLANRRAAQKSAAVEWADRKAIKAKYVEARRMSQETGQLYHVDHIIPLKGEQVCGLHWEGNLQVIPAAMNQSKKNKLLPQYASS